MAARKSCISSGAEVVPYELTLRERVISAIADPNIGFILLVVGALGIVRGIQLAWVNLRRRRGRHSSAAGGVVAGGAPAQLGRSLITAAGRHAVRPGSALRLAWSPGHGRNRRADPRRADADQRSAGDADPSAHGAVGIDSFRADYDVPAVAGHTSAAEQIADGRRRRAQRDRRGADRTRSSRKSVRARRVLGCRVVVAGGAGRGSARRCGGRNEAKVEPREVLPR